MSELIRTMWRVTTLVWHLLNGFVQAAYQRLRFGETWHQYSLGQATISRWMKQLARILGLHVQVSSPALPVPTMIVANHVSWLDIIAIGSVRPAQFLAKDNVRGWPFIGALVALCGTQFIKRGRVSALRECNKNLCHSLRVRQHVAIFPEGTTSAGADVGIFHPALFEAPIQAYCPIQPLAIRYQHNGRRDSIAPYVDDDIFILHLWRILKRRETCVQLQFLPPISSRGHRRQLAVQSHALIVSALREKESVATSESILQPMLKYRAAA